MRVTVLDDVRPGFALLEFEPGLEDPLLYLTVRSVGQEQYLGAGGKWAKVPHTFTAERVEIEGEPARYRVGPEIVNYMLEHDGVEIAAADKSWRADGLWENAIPQLPGQGKSPSAGFTIFRAAPTMPEPLQSAPVPPPSAKAAPVVPPVAEQPSVAPAPETPDDALAEPDPPPPIRKPRPVPPPPEPATRWFLAIGMAVALFSAGFLSVSANLRCSLLGLSCPDPVNGPEALLKRANDCAKSALEERPCDAAACFKDYLAKTPPSEIDQAAQTTVDDAEQRCTAANEADDKEAAQARECTAAKARANDICFVRSQCVMPYLAKFSAGKARSELQELATKADKDCEAAKLEEIAANKARQCVSRNEARRIFCEIERDCIEPYRTAFPAGVSLDSINSMAAAAKRACDADAAKKAEHDRQVQEEARQAETDAYQAARQCADGATNPCVRTACYDGYLSKYRTSGANSAAAQSAADRARSECQPGNTGPAVEEPAQVGDIDGTYRARTRTGCGSPPQSVGVVISQGKITWRHEHHGIEYQWDGTIDAQGNIAATVGGSKDFVATGKYTDESKDITIRYPQCGSEPVEMQIWQRTK